MCRVLPGILLEGVAGCAPEVKAWIATFIYSSLSSGVLLARPLHSAPEMEDQSTGGRRIGGVRRDAWSLLARPDFPVATLDMRTRVAFCHPRNAFSRTHWAGKEAASRAVIFSAVWGSCTSKHSRVPPCNASRSWESPPGFWEAFTLSKWLRAAEMPSKNWQLLPRLWFLQLQWAALGHFHEAQTLLKMIQSKGSAVTPQFCFDSTSIWTSSAGRSFVISSQGWSLWRSSPWISIREMVISLAYTMSPILWLLCPFLSFTGKNSVCLLGMQLFFKARIVASSLYKHTYRFCNIKLLQAFTVSLLA